MNTIRSNCSQMAAGVGGRLNFAESDVEFLKDQVQRLSSILAVYQKKYHLLPQPNDEDLVFAKDKPRPEWLFEKSYLVPLLTEYDRVISQQEQQVLELKEEVRRLNGVIAHTTEENTRLNKEKTRLLEIQSVSPANSLRLSGKGLGLDLDLVEHLQQKVESLTGEKNSYEELSKKTEQELKQFKKNYQEVNQLARGLKEELAKTKSKEKKTTVTAVELRNMCQVLDQEKQKLLLTAQAQEKELTSLHESFSACKSDLQKELTKNVELKKTLDEIAIRLQKKEADRAVWMDQEKAVDERIHHLELANTELESKLMATERELVLLREERAEIEDTSNLLSAQVATLKEKESETVAHIKESVQLAENAIVEKEQAQIREQQKLQEIARLKSVLSQVVKEAGERAREEVERVKEEYNMNITKMAEEIRLLELDCSKKQAEMDKALRGMKSAERELDKIQHMTPSQAEQSIAVIQDLKSKLLSSERQKNNALLRQQRVESLAKQTDEQLTEERKKRVQEEEGFRKLKIQLEEEADTLRNEKLVLLKQIEGIRHQLRLSDQAKTAIQDKHQREVASLMKTHELKESETRQKIESKEHSQRERLHKLRQELSKQDKINAKYRTEAKMLLQKFESTVSDLRNESDRRKHINQELMLELRKMRQDKHDLQEEIAKLSSDFTACQHELGEAEGRAKEAVEQLSELLEREKALREERRSLHQKLDRMKIGMTHSLGLDPRLAHPTTNTFNDAQTLDRLLTDIYQGSVSGPHQRSHKSKKHRRGDMQEYGQYSDSVGSSGTLRNEDLQ